MLTFLNSADWVGLFSLTLCNFGLDLHLWVSSSEQGPAVKRGQWEKLEMNPISLLLSLTLGWQVLIRPCWPHVVGTGLSGPVKTEGPCPNILIIGSERWPRAGIATASLLLVEDEYTPATAWERLSQEPTLCAYCPLPPMRHHQGPTGWPPPLDPGGQGAAMGLWSAFPMQLCYRRRLLSAMWPLALRLGPWHRLWKGGQLCTCQIPIVFWPTSWVKWVWGWDCF